jgi:hypothetical protein
LRETTPHTARLLSFNSSTHVSSKG